MAILTPSEKLKILATGKATLKEINELEKLAEKEDEQINETKVDETKVEETKVDETKVEDEKDKRIAELEAQLKEAQSENVHGNSGGNEPSFDEQLDSMFNDYRF